MTSKSRFLDRMERVGRSGGQRWRSAEGDRYYEWDPLHREIEVYDKRGYHLGAADPDTGVVFKPAKPGRRIDV